MENESLNLIVNQLTAGGLAVWLIQKFKAKLAKVGVVQEAVSKIARVMAALVAALAAIGISFAFDPSAGVLTISGLTWSTVGVGIWEWARQYVVQQVMFRGYKLSKNGEAKP
jgi:hypothetical protein